MRIAAGTLVILHFVVSVIFFVVEAWRDAPWYMFLILTWSVGIGIMNIRDMWLYVHNNKRVNENKP